MTALLTPAFWLLVSLLSLPSAAMLSARWKNPALAELRVLLTLTLAIGMLSLSLLVAGVVGHIGVGWVGAIQVLVFLVVAAACPECRTVSLGWAKRKSTLDPSTVVAIATVLVSLFGLLIAATRVAPGSDATAHHLPMARWILKHGLLSIPGGFRVPDRPAEVALLYAWGLCGSGRPVLLAMMNVGFAAVLGFAAFSICRCLGVRRQTALWAPAFILGNYLLTNQVTTLYVDLALAAFVISALAFSLAYFKSPQRECLIGSAVATGLAIAAKPDALPYLAVILLPIVVPQAGKQPAQNVKRTARALAVFATTAFVFCGFWYIRNLLLQGRAVSELYSPSFVTRTAMLFNLPDFVREFGLRGFISDIAGQTSWLTVASFIPALVLTFRIGRLARFLGIGRGCLILFLVMTALSVAILLVHPCTASHTPDGRLLVGGQLRYGMPACALLMVCWVLIFVKIPAWLPVLCLGLALVASRTAAVLALACTGLLAKHIHSAR